MTRWPLLALFCIGVVVEHLGQLLKEWAKEKLVDKPDDSEG